MALKVQLLIIVLVWVSTDMVVKQSARFSDLPLSLIQQLPSANANPFLNEAFLSALEETGCVAAETGWQPCHLWLEDAGAPVFYLPLYRKAHSWGEFVFDQNWADAYHRNGLRYYPKLVTSIPFTPSSGPRWWAAEGYDQSELWKQVFDVIRTQIKSGADSSWHLLFSEQAPPANPDGLLLSRRDTQFHWNNRGYNHFDDFLATLKSRKRKSLRRERQKVMEQGVTLCRVTGTELNEQDWLDYFQFYCNTYHQRGMEPHLNLAFFQRIGRTLANNVLMVQAYKEGRFIGGSLCFFDAKVLYGRHWGAIENIDCLHFEACFYQGIEFCIERGLSRFDPGTQGEHKLIRGFEPVTTTSWHYISHSGFRHAIAQYLQSEQQHMQQYQENATEYLPFKITEN
ncbi:N-acetyltransferase [Ketobacter sp. MCCC 1A13808]|uniref:GNAT family N-acetyltransferase n=1 Tax=Ketobacter sp. MCCC 1A13808 TaxID=2602738 RepID=UPI0012EC32B7|nr:GNAT family N-acetyltransferase [Ketobacter sp. MCCC 1A13808]MVF14629.1 N-acetyltransferase [Ketobacter sp. MCCC 1A13808]